MPIGGQEGIQVLRAGQQLDADLIYSSSLGTFPASDIASLGDYSKRVFLNAAIPPAGADLPIIKQLDADLAFAHHLVDEVEPGRTDAGQTGHRAGLVAIASMPQSRKSANV